MSNRNPNDIDPQTVDPAYRAFAMLPRLTKIAPEYQAKDADRIALIPIFSDSYQRVENIPALLQSAIYSRASCLKNTDAVAQGVEVKLYVEDYIGNRLAVQMMRNGIHPDEDVLYFDTTIHEWWNYMGKKTYSYYDPQLSEYNQVIVWDSDIYFPPTNRTATFFSQLSQLPQTLFYVHINDMFPDWKEYLERNIRLSNLSVNEILTHVGIEVPTYPIRRPVGALWVNPSKYLHHKHGEMLDWIREASRLIGCDEVTVAFACFRFGCNLSSLRRFYQLSMASISQHWLSPRDETTYLHMFVPPNKEQACIDYIQSII